VPEERRLFEDVNPSAAARQIESGCHASDSTAQNHNGKFNFGSRET
jgi:hypothetical protein